MIRFAFAAVASLVLLTAVPVLAGPPLICFPFDTHGAKTLPMGSKGWQDIDPTYDTSKLVDDTLALLTPEAPIIVHMETLRRATIYASTKPGLGAALLSRIDERARTATPSFAPVASFDFDYLVETYRQAAPVFKTLPSVDHFAKSSMASRVSGR
ncbi:MAG TPA: hypothetical protein VFA59_13270 [Vicinamibacterales bacterium]|nr:hypothetical protein [Vicinamibacterales bacterium]